MRPLRTAARGMLGATFVSGGIRAVASPEKLVPLAVPITDRFATTMQKRYPHFPTNPRTLVRINGAVQLAAGLLLASGRVRRPAAVALAASLVPTTLAGHSFWNQPDPSVRRQQQVDFMKNVSMLGGLLMAAVDTEGHPNMMWRATHLARDTKRSAKHASRSVKRLATLGVAGQASRGLLRQAKTAQRGLMRQAKTGRRGVMRQAKTGGLVAGWNR